MKNNYLLSLYHHICQTENEELHRNTKFSFLMESLLLKSYKEMMVSGVLSSEFTHEGQTYSLIQFVNANYKLKAKSKNITPYWRLTQLDFFGCYLTNTSDSNGTERTFDWIYRESARQDSENATPEKVRLLDALESAYHEDKLDYEMIGEIILNTTTNVGDEHTAKYQNLIDDTALNYIKERKESLNQDVKMKYHALQKTINQELKMVSIHGEIELKFAKYDFSVEIPALVKYKLDENKEWTVHHLEVKDNKQPLDMFSNDELFAADGLFGTEGADACHLLAEYINIEAIPNYQECLLKGFKEKKKARKKILTQNHVEDFHPLG